MASLHKMLERQVWQNRSTCAFGREDLVYLAGVLLHHHALTILDGKFLCTIESNTEGEELIRYCKSSQHTCAVH